MHVHSLLTRSEGPQVLVDNAVSTPLSAQTFDYWFAGGSV
jgi:hypothetical protein